MVFAYRISVLIIVETEQEDVVGHEDDDIDNQVSDYSLLMKSLDKVCVLWCVPAVVDSPDDIEIFWEFGLAL